MFRCNPSPNETIVTITATPTITPIVVSMARSFAWRRFRKASLSMSRKLMIYLERGGKRSATPLWLLQESPNPERCRARLATALHKRDAPRQPSNQPGLLTPLQRRRRAVVQLKQYLLFPRCACPLAGRIQSPVANLQLPNTRLPAMVGVVRLAVFRSTAQARSDNSRARAYRP